MPGTWTVFRMSSRQKKRYAEMVGGEKISKQRPLRQRIRDVKRVLSRDQLPETVRLTKERMLKSLQEELNEAIDEKYSQKIAKKYKMVKFFERRKVCRKLKAQMKLYDSSLPDDRGEIEEAVSRLRKELNYIVHSGTKYQALYPSTESSEKSVARRENRLAAIAEGVASGEIPDASLEFCSHPLRMEEEGCKEARLTETKEKGVTIVERRKSRPQKTAPVDQEPESDCEATSCRNLCGDDDFFLDAN